MDGHTEKLEMELCPEGPNISHSHLSAPHKYSSQIRSASPSSLSLQDELMISTSGGISNESGYVSFSGSRKDSSSSASSSINSFIRRKESLSTVVLGRKESLMSRKDSTLSTWSSPEYDLTYSEMIGETSHSSGPSSILLSKYTIPEEESPPCRSDVAHYSSGERGELTPESSPFSLIRNKVLSSPVLGDSIFQNKLHQNYKDIFKEMFSILRKAQY